MDFGFDGDISFGLLVLLEGVRCSRFMTVMTFIYFTVCEMDPLEHRQYLPAWRLVEARNHVSPKIRV